MKMVTVAEKTVRGKTYRYTLKHDKNGYYWDGMECGSFRRRTRSAIEKRAGLFRCDITEIESNTK